MKRLSRHTVVVLLAALLGGLTLAVVAFGQTGGNPDATVPAGDYTGTTPPLSPYATTPATTPTATTPTRTTPTQTQSSTTVDKPQRRHGTATEPPHGTGNLPSRATRNGPTHLAFTGGEPIYVGFLGVALMLGGLTLHRRRRALPGRR